MRWLAIVVLTACYTATPAFDVPCDPARARCPNGQACIAGSDGFACMPEGTPPAIDAGISNTSTDGPVPRRFPCAPSDPTQRACFGFDNAFANPLPDEASAGVAIDLTNVTRVAVDGGGAALLTTQSAMYIPTNTRLTDLVAIDVRIRLDEPITTRVGLLDADASEPGLSMFLYANPMRLRCDFGDMVYVEIALELGVWTELACTCEGDTLAMYQDGVRIAQHTGCAVAAATTQGLQIGQNSRVDQNLPPDEHFVGAIDRVRLWTAVPAY